MNKNSKGQVILFVIVSATIAMAIGVTVATRTLSSLSRSASTDTSNRALAAAESGAERYLAMDYTDLGNLVGTDIPEIIFEDASSTINTKAKITIEEFSSNSDTGAKYEFALGTDYVKEVSFRNSSFSGDVYFCWDNENAAIAYYSYSPAGNVAQGIVVPSNNFDFDVEGQIVAESGRTGFEAGCRKVLVTSATDGLRLRALYEDTNVGIFSTNELPIQGYKITSVGSLVEEGKVITTKRVVVYKSVPYLPAVFDFAVYTEENFN